MQQEKMLWENMGTQNLRFLCTQCDALHLAKYLLYHEELLKQAFAS